MTGPYFLGIDVGTQGVRVVLLDAGGNIVRSCEEIFHLDKNSREEQSPLDWWESCLHSLKRLFKDSGAVIDLKEILAASVTSTSGTVIPLDAKQMPLHNAIMYSDMRSVEEGKFCQKMAKEHNPHGYTGFNSSSGLSKIIWYGKKFPEKVNKIARWVHATDYIIGMLSGQWGITDSTNALKTGYDLRNNVWPQYLHEQLLLNKNWFPVVVPPGTSIGKIQNALAVEFGLSENLQIVAGMTDGCASQVASGAISPGEWNATIGTTLVIKGVTTREIIDPEGRLYNHRHPEGFWMPGGASNIGADWVTNNYKDLANLEKISLSFIPTGFMAYPLQQPGERFPFIAPHARGFIPEGLNSAQAFAASMEGVAYIERYAYELIEELSGEKVKAVYCAGGGSKNNTWLHIRSNVLNLPLYKNKHVTGAVGAAILAASKTYFRSVTEAVRKLTCVEKNILPSSDLVEEYEKYYKKFINILKDKKIIS